MFSNMLEIHGSSEDKMMVTAPSSPLRQSCCLPQRECQDQGTSAAGPKIVESSPQLGIESSSMPGEQMRVVPKATQRVLRNVSASSQEKIKQARGSMATILGVYVAFRVRVGVSIASMWLDT
ncbi:hypothetical protein EB796_007580 [Bugula neritina]|uniref:Uncharacterized protein n=1 Tax=Bugula neritina TaxID=10212 RepID=A0A7J7K930_BUGNE|nr:hypothetical protein EB796_007580 [Bugula neritina]